MYKYPYQNMSLEDMEGEIWKELPGYENYIQLSNYGRVKRLKRLIETNQRSYWLKERIVKHTIIRRPDTKGIECILTFSMQITEPGLDNVKTVIHIRCITSRAVYSTFVKPISYKNDLFVIRYKDNDPLNIGVNNLYIETRSSVARKHTEQKIITPPDFYRISLTAQYNMKNLCNKTVSQFDKNGIFLQTYPSISNAARVLNGNVANIASAINKARTSYGFFWRYGEDTSPISPEILYKYKNPHSDRCKPVSQYTKENELIATYKSIEDAARQIGCSSRLINMAVHGKIERAKGFFFRFSETTENKEKKKTKERTKSHIPTMTRI